jgi:hypothetical protein
MSMLNLPPGGQIRRTELHEQYGGRRQGGISPSRDSDNVFIITTPEGEAYGYIYDGWSDDGFFYYTGEGQQGDQQMVQGNRAIRDHEQPGRDRRDLHLFVAHGTELEYVGQFRYRSHQQADAPDVNDAELRKVIVFQLEQLSGSRIGPNRTRLDRLGDETVKEIPVEQSLTETMLIEGGEPHVAERTEQQVVRGFAERLEREGHDICRLQLRPEGEAAPLFCDLFDKTTGTLYEAKGTVTRSAMRMAIGQLADYARFVQPAPRKAVLMPEKPRADLLQLASTAGLEVMWTEDGRFVGTFDPDAE